MEGHASWPAWVVTGLAVAVTATGGYLAGQQMYEAGSGRRWSHDGNGDELSDADRSEAVGGSVVTLCTLGMAGSKWYRAGSSGDGRWLKLRPLQRVQFDMDEIALSDSKYGEVGGLPPGQRNVSLKHWRPGRLPKIWGTGASPALRSVWPYILGGAVAAPRATRNYGSQF